MKKTTIRIATLAAALLFGAATALPLTTTSADAATQQKPAAAHVTKKKMVHKGSAAVKSMQEALNKNGAKLSVDGKMGPKTRAALKSFQQGHGLKATGKLDAATKKALGIG
jgi:peptidoglycan hydrolase-like protein with peptidoglycan-binding domain